MCTKQYYKFQTKAAVRYWNSATRDVVRFKQQCQQQQQQQQQHSSLTAVHVSGAPKEQLEPRVAEFEPAVERGERLRQVIAQTPRVILHPSPARQTPGMLRSRPPPFSATWWSLRH